MVMFVDGLFYRYSTSGPIIVSGLTLTRERDVCNGTSFIWNAIEKFEGGE